MVENSYKFLSFRSYSNLTDWSVRNKETIDTVFTNGKRVKLSKLLTRIKEAVTIEDNKLYKRVTIKLYGNGVQIRDTEYGKNIGTKRQFLIKSGQFILSGIDARNGALGIVPDDLDGAIITNDFWTFQISPIVNPQYLLLFLSSSRLQDFWGSQSSGTTGRQRISESKFLNLDLYLPPIEIQEKIVNKYNTTMELAKQNITKANELERSIDKVIFDELGIEEIENKRGFNGKYKFLRFTSFKKLVQWGVDKNTEFLPYKFTKYDPVSYNSSPKIYLEIFRGKSPKYSNDSNTFILNQKCNRWNEIQIKYAKLVDEQWIESIDKRLFTNEGDILINSTGEGTIGRSSCIEKVFSNLLFDSHMLLLRVNREYINPLYWVYVINSSFGQKQINLLKGAQATKQTELGVENVKNIQIPLPPIQIQNQVAKKVFDINEEIKGYRHMAEQLKSQSTEEFEGDVFGGRC